MIFCKSSTFLLYALPKSLRLFSSSPAGRSSFFSVNLDGWSPAYRRALQCKRPPTIYSWQIAASNSVSLIGRIVFPVARYPNTLSYVWTLLQQKSPSSESILPLQIVIEMQDKMAEIALQHLRQNDFVYVSGQLRSYMKNHASGDHEIRYKVIVKELNYVTRKSEDQTCQNLEISDLNKEKIPTSNTLDFREVDSDRLRLWQVFFANPCDWWDNRRSKTNPRAPDFKHKDTLECLSLSPNDPPWIRTQLQLLDLEMAEQRQRGHGNARLRVSEWRYE